MRLVLDANVIFAALIKAGMTRHILLLSGHTFFVPDFFYDELREHLPELAGKAGLPEVRIRTLLNTLLAAANVQLADYQDFKGFIKRAKAISPDPADTPYLALALRLDCGVWSNDKRLQQQNTVKVFTTEMLAPKHGG